jgi:hypothetical protein
MLKLRKKDAPTTVQEFAATFRWEPQASVKLTATEIRSLSALCEGQGLLHVMNAGPVASPKRAAAWRDLSVKLLQGLDGLGDKS